jgi:phytoene dehydrogenase-like protein
MGPLRVPRHPFLLARFGLSGLRSVASVAESRFHGEAAKAVLAGSAAHSMLTLTTRPTAAIALAEGALGHAFGWPLVRGGSQQLADALASYFESLGGTIVTEETISRMAELPDSPAVLFDLTPRQVLSIAGDELPHRYRRRLSRYRYGLGVFKVDLALSGPIPWKASECELAATLHVGGTIDEIAASEEAAWSGRPPERPFVLFAQQSLFDSTRAPIDKHTAWAYCHVPAGSTFDMTDRIEAQLERFAPGFKDLILERHVMSPVEMERYNPNYVGGDINGGVQDLRQLFTRPVARVVPYSTPNPRIFICSSSTPPGGGVHGMCGYFAARAVLRSRRTQRSAES